MQLSPAVYHYARCRWRECLDRPVGMCPKIASPSPCGAGSVSSASADAATSSSLSGAPTNDPIIATAAKHLAENGVAVKDKVLKVNWAPPAGIYRQ